MFMGELVSTLPHHALVFMPMVVDVTMVMVMMMVMPVPVLMIVVVVVIMAMVIHLNVLGFGIAVHERFHDLAQRILLKGDVRGQKSCQSRKHERLGGQQPICVAVLRLLAVACAARQGISE